MICPTCGRVIPATTTKQTKERRGQSNELGWAKTEAQALNILKLFLLEAHAAT